jgi:hypothetical protein
MLLGPAGIIGVGVVPCGSGNGIGSIVPRAVFGGERYAILMEWLAMPQPCCATGIPSISSLLIGHLGPNLTIGVLTGTALVNMLRVLPLVPLTRRRPVMAKTLRAQAYYMRVVVAIRTIDR